MPRIDRLHPAVKHGAYSATAVLPGESPAEFQKLHRDLIAEFAPSGVLEDDIVTTMARLVWRKQNLATLRIAERAQSRRSAILREKMDDLEPALFISEEEAAKDREEERQAKSETLTTRFRRSSERATNSSKLVQPRHLAASQAN